jgi:hydroxymethylpyrimidine/phosphomethylpyrimidine kinase
MKPVALTIAGSDPSGGAGIQADLKTFHQFGVYGEAVVTLLTVQNTVRVSRVECMSAALVLEQIRAVVEDIRPMAAKTGALGERAIVEAVAGIAMEFDFPLVVDPVMISKHGAPLMAEDAREAVREKLLPRAYLLTPNLAEAEALAGFAIRDVSGMRASAVLVKGGHLEGAAVDVLYHDGVWHEFPAPRIDTPHTHGTGCTYSAAITAELARGAPLVEAVSRAKAYITEAIRTAPRLGSGSGPVNHHAGVAEPR